MSKQALHIIIIIIIIINIIIFFFFFFYLSIYLSIYLFWLFDATATYAKDVGFEAVRLL